MIIYCIADTREKAFIYAISAAGIMYSVTRACAKGQLHICGCDQKIRRSEPKGQFIWGGCSHNVRYGNKFTKQFTDLREDQQDAEGLMNLWNNDAGRKVTYMYVYGKPSLNTSTVLSVQVETTGTCT